MYYSSDTLVFLDGAFVQATAAMVSVYNQTLHYGNGVFEGIRAYETNEGSRIFKAQAHYERLIRSCELMDIPFAYGVDELTHLTYELLQRNGLTNAYIRPLVMSDNNMSLGRPQSSSLLIAAWEWNYFSGKLLRLGVSSFCRPHPSSVIMEAKAAGYYVNSILASNDAKKRGYDEALMLDHAGYIAEAPGANIFFEKDGRLYTPAEGSILPGITRATVIDLCASLDIPVEIGRFTIEDLYQADGAFYCGTGAEITGIGSIDEIIFPKPWEETVGKKIQEEYGRVVRRRLVGTQA